MPELPTCECISGYPPYDRLTFIYQAAAELGGDDSLPSADCVAGVPPFHRFAYIYAAFRVLAGDDSLPSMECVEGEPFQDQVTRIYEAARAYAADSDLPAVGCVRGTPIWQQWVNIYAALYSAAGEPDELVSPFCVNPSFDSVLNHVFCGLVYLIENGAPVLLSAVVMSGGEELHLTFSQPVFGQNGFVPNYAGPPDLVYISGEGTTTYVYVFDPPITPGESITLDYTPGNIVNALGVPMEAFVDFPVDNGQSFTYLRPGGVDTYFRPDGTSIYIRP